MAWHGMLKHGRARRVGGEESFDGGAELDWAVVRSGSWGSVWFGYDGMDGDER